MSACCQGVDEFFNERTARFDLKRYRRRGPSKQTSVLLAAIRERGVEGASLLDIGGGIGAIQQELLAAGAAHATSVEASPAYLRAAREEAARRGTTDRIDYQSGDFVALADAIESADLVTLDRVICCYPDMEALVGASATRARRVYGLVYPQDGWWVRAGVRVANFANRLRRRAFRAHVHTTTAVDAAVRANGLTPALRRRVGPVWQVVVYTRG
jgi:magnesium-protoporphyrin O-methyltransferase